VLKYPGINQVVLPFAQLFDEVRKIDPLLLDKVVGVRGNLMEPSLGMSEADEAAVTRDVSVVFHSAATVNFEEVSRITKFIRSRFKNKNPEKYVLTQV
jgi:hypothetical protein